MGRPLSPSSAASGSLWAAAVSPTPRAALPGDRSFDVAIVGGGFTGLWTAYYLATSSSLRIAVLEAEHVGFGASGRNGGWCSALFPASLASLAALPGSSRSRALAQHEAMRGSVREVGRVAALEGIDCSYARGGTISLARSPAQLVRARAEVAEAEAWGRTDLSLLSAPAATAILDATRTLGATYTEDCAAIHPAETRARSGRGLRTARGQHLRGDPGAVHRSRPGRLDARAWSLRGT